MRTARITTIMLAAAFAGMEFPSAEHDPLRVEEPRRPTSVCGITRARVGREAFLFAPAGDDSGGGGDEKKFSQADVDKIVQERVGGLNKKLEAKDAQLTALAKDVETLKAAATEAEAAKQAAIDAEKTKGMGDLEKAQHNLGLAQQKIKDLETAHQAALAKINGELDGERNGRVHDAKQNFVTTLLASGAAPGMAGYAASALLTEGQFEIDDKRQITKVTFEGQIFEKPADLATAFYKARPGFAKAPEGGSNHPKGGGGGGGPNGLDQHTSPESLIGAGLQQRAQST